MGKSDLCLGSWHSSPCEASLSKADWETQADHVTSLPSAQRWPRHVGGSTAGIPDQATGGLTQREDHRLTSTQKESSEAPGDSPFHAHKCPLKEWPGEVRTVRQDSCMKCPSADCLDPERPTGMGTWKVSSLGQL